MSESKAATMIGQCQLCEKHYALHLRLVEGLYICHLCEARLGIDPESMKAETLAKVSKGDPDKRCVSCIHWRAPTLEGTPGECMVADVLGTSVAYSTDGCDGHETRPRCPTCQQVFVPLDGEYDECPECESQAT